MKHKYIESELVPIEVLAQKLHLSKAFLKDETRAGRIPCLRAGNRTRYNPASVVAALAQQASGNSGSGVSDE